MSRNRLDIRRARLGLNGDHPRVGKLRLDRDRHARCQASPAQGHDHAPRRRRLARDLQTHRPLAGDDVRVVERRDERPAFGLREVAGGMSGLVVGAGDQVDLPSVAPHRGDLREGRFRRHEQVGMGAAAVGGESHGLGVVAGARRHDAGAKLLRSEPADPVKRAPDLERAR